jgi:oxygen-independent coproporphyrinogen-3 oxidase
MAGIYIHIPFCKQACHYCNFHFSLTLKRKNELIDALLLEIAQRKVYLRDEEINTIYIGGGTPSLLDYEDLCKIRDQIYSTFKKINLKEFTLEANPDDLSKGKIADIKKIGINRLSIGIQSFHDEDLKYMNRAHTASEAISSILRCQDAGIENLSIDLIYGTPTMNYAAWLENIYTALNTNVPHISAYALTVEPKTKLQSLIKKKLIESPIDEQVSEQFFTLIDKLEENKFEQYEISNFCMNEMYAIHNTSYWQGTHYLGIGPSAHSYDGENRSWNISNNNQYINSIKENKSYIEIEHLNFSNRVNEYIMTSLRTKWGMDLQKITTIFSQEVADEIRNTLIQEIPSNYYTLENNIVKLTIEGKLMADGIASNLFILI